MLNQDFKIKKVNELECYDKVYSLCFLKDGRLVLCNGKAIYVYDMNEWMFADEVVTKGLITLNIKLNNYVMHVLPHFFLKTFYLSWLAFILFLSLEYLLQFYIVLFHFFPFFPHMKFFLYHLLHPSVHIYCTFSSIILVWFLSPKNSLTRGSFTDGVLSL